MHILKLGGHPCESTWLQTVLLFFTFNRCVDVYLILAYVTIGSYVSCVNSLHICNCLQVKILSIIDEPAHVAVGLQLLEMRSITTLNQTILNVCTRYIFQGSFLGKILTILAICDNEKIQYDNCVLQNCFDFWNLCKCF